MPCPVSTHPVHRYQYANIFKLCDTIGIPDPFTPWTSSSFYSPKGLQVIMKYFIVIRLNAIIRCLIDME